MKIWCNSRCELLGANPETLNVYGELAACPGGYFVTNLDANDNPIDIKSVQPNGDVSTRPLGTTPGAYEICQPDSSINVLRYNPGVPYALAYHG